MSTVESRSLVPGYALGAEIHRGGKSVVYRATRERDGRSVVVKTFLGDYPTPAQTAGLRREFGLLHGLGIRGVPEAYALETHRGRPALILEDIGGTTLKALIAADPLAPDLFLDLATKLALTVGDMHRRGIIHKDINPSNVIVNPATGEVRLIDFGIATRMSAERQRHLQHPRLLEGTIAYMSPEQTGRMNRDVDYRSDLYSLGVTFYETLTGRVPFESADALAVIHGHVAKTPLAPAALNRAVPRPLSDLIMRLLAKSAEDRYQSAEGVVADLVRCRAAWERDGSIPDFPLGQDDVRDRFVVPQRLYGREAEVERLLAAFDRVAAGGTELALVSGYSGIGKTSLVQEVHRSLAQGGGHFVAGKFDQLARDVPYAALAQAFQGLVRHLLAETDDGIAAWRTALLDGLGANGQVIVDVIPNLARLIGPQPAVPPLGATESQHRFNRVFQQFLSVMARPERPLVLFVDDLQWADPASLSLLPLFLGNPDIAGLLVIGAYRDNEVFPSHPLAQTIQHLKERGAALTELTLPPLGPADLGALLTDTMGGGPSSIDQLTAAVLDKTGGNPFFVTQFLRSLHEDGQITFDRQTRCWRADLAAIRTLGTTDNVVDLMAGRILRLGEPTRRALRLAACVGNQFDLETLATVSEADPADCARDLWPAVEQGLVLADEHTCDLASDFRFLHDRVQQAAYALIPMAAKVQAHLTVGRLLLARGGDPTPTEWLFDVVHQLNVGAELMDDPAERLRLAELNLAAGRKAKSSAAFPSALGYFAAGTALLPADAWELHHVLAFALHLERAEAEYLTSRLAEAEAGFAALLPRSRSSAERTDVYVAMIMLFETMARYRDAIRAGLEGLRSFGIDLSEDPATQEAAFADDLAAIRRHLDGRPVAGLLDLPRLTEPHIRQAMRLLMAVWAPSYISSSSNLWSQVATRMVRLSLEHGNSEESAFGYLHHGVTVGSVLGQYESGYEFGRLAIALNERLNDHRLRAVVYHRFAALVLPFSRPFATCIAHAREAVRSGLESGNLQVAGYAQFQQSWYGMLLEEDLAGFREKYSPNVDFLAQLQSPAFLEAQRLILQWALALEGRTSEPTAFTTPGFDEATFLETTGKVGIFRGLYATLKLELLYAHGQLNQARAVARDGEAPVEQFAGSIWPAMFLFWHVLTLCEWLSAASPGERSETDAKVDELAGRLRSWAEGAPDNFRFMSLLASAEIARARGETASAFEGYEAALEEAQKHASPRHRALVNELYGKFWLKRHQPAVAAVFLREAKFAYRQWGAHAKVAHLERRHGDLLARQAAAAAPGLRAELTTQAQDSTLDLHAVIKAAQALAGEIDLERLLGRLMSVAIEHAGAERGHFLLEHDGAPAIHAVGTTDRVDLETDAGTPLADARSLPIPLVNLVRRTGETVVLDDAIRDDQFAGDPYLARERPRSVICTPVINQGRLIGALYLENNLAPGVFSADRAQILQMIAAQAAIAIENARLFGEIRQLKDRLQAENVYLSEEIKTQQGFEEIVGQSPVLKRVLARIEQVAGTDTTVLITGETGTGKELIARAIHQHSRRRDRALVSVNCGAISPGLVESELFGHEKGAFTGALSRKIGRFELADGGTIFLDEIGDLPLDLQVKLLRVLQEGEIERVGGTKTIKVDVRVMAATHQEMAKAVEQGRFRADLYYRLNVFPIHAPALRERRADIPMLVRHFVLKYGSRMGKAIEHVPTQTLDAFTAYDWPGNIRELANVIERSVIVSRGSVLELGDWIAPQNAAPAAGPVRTLEEAQRAHILEALEASNWRVSGPAGAAVRLGLKPTTLEWRMKKLGITRHR